MTRSMGESPGPPPITCTCRFPKNPFSTPTGSPIDSLWMNQASMIEAFCPAAPAPVAIESARASATITRRSIIRILHLLKVISLRHLSLRGAKPRGNLPLFCHRERSEAISSEEEIASGRAPRNRGDRHAPPGLAMTSLSLQPLSCHTPVPRQQQPLRPRHHPRQHPSDH